MNNNMILKVSRIVSIVFMAIGALFIILVLAKGDTAMHEVSAQDSILNPFFIFSYVILGLAAVLAIVFPIAYAISNPKMAIRGAIVVALFVVLFGISYFVASDTVSTTQIAKAVEEGRINASGIRLVGAGLIATYILTAAAIITLVYASISKLFK